MKKSFIFIIVLLLTVVQFANAQDILLFKNGQELKVKVIELSNTEISYKRFDNLDGPTIVIPKSGVFMITYENGIREVFEDVPATGQDISKTTTLNDKQENYPISNFALSLNPLGFIQFGPIINAEFGVSDNLVLNTHIRLTTLGVLSYFTHGVDIDKDKMKAMAFGGGLTGFLSKRQSKPYIGFLLEYEKAHKLKDVGQHNEYQVFTKSFIFMLNGGYRFRFDGGFYINTGVLAGFSFAKNNEFYTNSSYSDRTYSGSDALVAAMLELTLGYEF